MTTKAKKYQIIYADPSWYSQFSNNGIIAFQYPMVLKADIGNHNIQSITDKTVAFVWGNQNKKRDTLFFDLGNLTRFNSEICLLEMKGKQKRVSAKILQVILTSMKEHSKKLADDVSSYLHRCLFLACMSGERMLIQVKTIERRCRLWMELSIIYKMRLKHGMKN